MTANEISIALTIYLIIPLIGLLYFIRIAKQMKMENIEIATLIELFIIFSTYGGLLLVALTAIFWQWSGKASLGTFYLILGAPIVMGFISYRNREKKLISKYHKWAYASGLLYFAIAPVTIFVLFLFE